MQHRSIVRLILLTVVTFGIYAIVWTISTKDEMNRQGASIPTGWLLLVPVVNIWWTWKYCGGVELVTRGKQSQVVSFLLIAVLGIIGMAIIQDGFNKTAGLAPARS